jgi:2-hydroxycyclohexanecarboxyl-CoA dehydrogenase
MSAPALHPSGALAADLRGSVAWVTGGTAGVGLAIAQALLAAGATVVISGRDPVRGQQALERLGHAAASVVPGDCADPQQARAMAGQIVALHGRLDILVASGGAVDEKPGLFHEVPDGHFAEVYRHQFLNRVFPIRAALSALRERGGCVLLIGTDAGRHATVGETVHGSLGSATIMLTKTLAREFSRWDIRVNCLALTFTAGTDAFEEVMGRGDWLTALYQKAVRRFPRGRPPLAAEVAQAALFLVSAQATQITGQTISVNGGLSFGGW